MIIHLTDINECEEDPDICNIYEKCVNLPGSFKCVCAPGFFRGPEGNCLRICETGFKRNDDNQCEGIMIICDLQVI